jgi:hypothetical protein
VCSLGISKSTVSRLYTWQIETPPCGSLERLILDDPTYSDTDPSIPWARQTGQGHHHLPSTIYGRRLLPILRHPIQNSKSHIAILHRPPSTDLGFFWKLRRWRPRSSPSKRARSSTAVATPPSRYGHRYPLPPSPAPFRFRPGRGTLCCGRDSLISRGAVASIVGLPACM